MAKISLLLDAVSVDGPGDVKIFEGLKSEFSMQVVLDGTGGSASGHAQVWLEQSLDGVNFSRLTDNATGHVFNVEVVWGDGNPIVGSNLRYFPDGNVLAKAFRANLIFVAGSGAIVSAFLAAR